MSADTLSPNSREFFERSKLKQTLSLAFAGIGLLFFGMTCEDGGMSNSATIMEDSSSTSGDTEDMYAALSAGYGFSCFVKLLACILSFSVSLYFSSFLCGTLNEKKSLRTNLEIDETGSQPQEDMPPYVEPEIVAASSSSNTASNSSAPPYVSPIDKSGAV
mmetsp:Transcript_6469/g.10584  ORF Transcript_6469/g.10584 Transcript_6469/m.10584 type:complete len:161 (+) Transcript_6469:56-538(+)|eukprot:CAMPEP_0114433656 /NCGR_PEP_ID=MMETSP0103-20121206/11811_1 /TAXON_ID=37642 ORGANISM="Paraphysomonas imperforata, Strain PA2" /NCGR_SAMPLE_ID=MMETSP0103 /ASSEMBLY_ACC=CAM_ASM_000201 /LENGTH=160 /DNA_ID=CAMNT_0001603425 /DNA_START=56 /DNA_END=538 /DNA_ORIENTATION=-